jgi:hypothetical protein
MTELPEPMMPADADLRDFHFMPLDLTQLFNSEFDTESTDSEWRAGVTLWGKAWHQVPAASLPDSDASLCKLAGLGRDMETWRAIRAGALRGFVKCSDGRLYHRVLADKALNSLEGRRDRTTERAADRARKKRKQTAAAAPPPEPMAMSGECPSAVAPTAAGVPPEFHRNSTGIPPEFHRNLALKGEGEGYSKSSVSNETAAGGGASLKAQVFGPQRLWLVQASGRGDDAVRRLLGRWCGAHGDGVTLDAILEAVRMAPTDPIPYIEATLKRGDDDGVISFDEEAVKRRINGET